MKVVRAVQKEDLDDLMELIKDVGAGMTTLKPDRVMLRKRIALACDSFADVVPPEQRDYVFVMEETEGASREIVGICAIRSSVGLKEPFYNYRIGTLVHSSKELDVYTRMETLYLTNDLTGCSELCSLFLHPDHRNSTNGKLLSKSRFLFIAQFPHFFSKEIIAELRGYLRPDGSSPFWDHLGRHFFQMDFSRADDLSIVGKKSFIAELMPRHPLYVTYLHEDAQKVIGKVHVDTEPARRLLEEEGFHYDGYIDIFDAGPVLQARANELRASHKSALVDVADSVADAKNELTLVSNTNMQDFRIIVSDTAPVAGQIQLSAQQQVELHCKPGESPSQVRTMPLHSDYHE